jgi:hypothetical protein
LAGFDNINKMVDALLGRERPRARARALALNDV